MRSQNSKVRNSVKSYYKNVVRNSIEPSILNIFHKYENSAYTKQEENSLKYEVSNLLDHYINCDGMDHDSVYEVYNEVATDYNKNLINNNH